MVTKHRFIQYIGLWNSALHLHSATVCREARQSGIDGSLGDPRWFIIQTILWFSINRAWMKPSKAVSSSPSSRLVIRNMYTTKPRGRNSYENFGQFETNEISFTMFLLLGNVSLRLSGKFSEIDQVVKYIKHCSPALRGDDLSNAGLKVLIKDWKLVRSQAIGH